MSPYGFKCFLVCIKLVLLRSLYLFSQQNFPITFSVSFSVLFFFSSHICIFKVHSYSSYLNPHLNSRISIPIFLIWFHRLFSFSISDYHLHSPTPPTLLPSHLVYSLDYSLQLSLLSFHLDTIMSFQVQLC